MQSGRNSVIYGRKPVQLLLEKSPRRATRLWLDRRLDPKVADKFSRLARGRTVPVSAVDPGHLDRLTHRAVHQGVAVEADPLRLRNLSDLIALIKNPKSELSGMALVALDGVTDPQNFGAVCRTAECFGLAGVIFESKHAPPLGGAAYKASAGAIDFIPLFGVPNLVDALRSMTERNPRGTRPEGGSGMKSSGVVLIGLDAAADHPLGRTSRGHSPSPPSGGEGWGEGVAPSQRTVFILGSEGRGIRPQIKSIARLYAIPMEGRVGSLNVSAAAAAACFWWRMQRDMIK